MVNTCFQTDERSGPGSAGPRSGGIADIANHGVRFGRVLVHQLPSVRGPLLVLYCKLYKTSSGVRSCGHGEYSAFTTLYPLFQNRLNLKGRDNCVLFKCVYVFWDTKVFFTPQVHVCQNLPLVTPSFPVFWASDTASVWSIWFSLCRRLAPLAVVCPHSLPSVPTASSYGI